MNNLVNQVPFSKEQLTIIINALKAGHNLQKGNGNKVAACELANVDRRAFVNLMENNPKIKEMVESASKIGDNLPIMLVMDFDVDNFSLEEINTEVESVEVEETEEDFSSYPAVNPTINPNI